MKTKNNIKLSVSPIIYNNGNRNKIKIDDQANKKRGLVYDKRAINRERTDKRR